MAEIGRGEEGVEHDFEAVVEDFGDDSGEKGTTYFKAWVGVDFYQVKSEIFINHEIVAKKFEAILEPLGVNFSECRLVSIRYKFLNLRENVPMKVKVKIGLLGTYNFGEILPTQFVSILKFSVIVSLLLYRIIC